MEGPEIDSDLNEEGSTETSDSTPLEGADVSAAEVNEPFAEALIQVSNAVARLDQRLLDFERLYQQQTHVIDRLHAENQQLKQGELAQSLAPLYRDLIRLHDDIRKAAMLYSSSTVQSAPNVDYFAETVVDILARYGVEVITVTPGESFDPKRHRAMETVETNDPACDRQVLEVVRPGFQLDTRTLRAADVRVSRYVPAPTPSVSPGPIEAINEIKDSTLDV